MASKAKKLSVVSGAGFLTQVWTILDKEVRELSGDNAVDHLHRLSTDDGIDTIRKMAEIIVAHAEIKSQAKPVRDRQMRYLEYVIAESVDATDFGKQALIWMLRQTKNLSRNIGVSFPFKWNEEKVCGLYKSVHDMCSDNGSTHLWRTFAAMGVDSDINSHSGLYEGQAQKLNHDLPGYTVWVSNRAFYDHTAERIEPDFAAIESINISPAAIYGDGFYDTEKEISLLRVVSIL